MILRSVLLFDSLIVDSARLTEVPALARVFGVDGLLALIQARVIRFKLTALTFAQIGQGPITARKGRAPLPLGSFNISMVVEHDHSDYVERSLRFVEQVDASDLTRKKLRDAIVASLVDLGPDPITRRMKPLGLVIENSHPVLSIALRDEYRRFRGVELPQADLSYRFVNLGDGDIRLESNLTSDLGVSEGVAHKIGERALLAVGHLLHELDLVSQFDAVTDIEKGHASLLTEYVPFLGPRATETSLATGLARLTDVAGLPVAKSAIGFHIDADKLLKYRASVDFTAFRDTLGRLNSLKDVEIGLVLRNFRKRLGTWIQTASGRTVRFLVNTAAGIAGDPLVGMAVGAFDSWLLERLLPRSPVIAVVREHLPRILRRRR